MRGSTKVPLLTHARLVFDQYEFDAPERRRPKGSIGVRRMLKSVVVDVWFARRMEQSITMPGDWTELGFDRDPIGLGGIMLQEDGATREYLFLPDEGENGEYYLRFGSRVFAAAHFTISPTAPLWPWRVVPWSDRSALSVLLGSTLVLWPRNQANQWEPFTEPLRVVAVYANSQRGNYGIGLCRALRSAAESYAASAGLRALSECGGENFAAREFDMGDVVRPEIILWGPPVNLTPEMHFRTYNDTMPVWTVLDSADSGGEDRTFRLVTPDELGSSPDLWQNTKATNALPDYDGVVLQQHNAVQCLECAREGRFGVPVISPVLLLCERHGKGRIGARIQHRTEQGEEFEKRMRAAEAKRPVLGFNRIWEPIKEEEDA